MPRTKGFWCKIATLCIVAAINAWLFFASLTINYQHELTREHVRFRSGFPSQANWVTSPYGRLHSYLFNVTNAEAFLAGTDKKIKFQEIGPISYRIVGRNNILEQTDDSLVYQKIRYHEVEFDPESSCSPDVLSKTITLPNFLLLGAAGKFNDWVYLVRHAFNAITINEPVFLTNTVHHFLWNFTSPPLNLLSTYVPNIVSNCGMLHNALREKDEFYNIKIGLNNGIENFFYVNTLNNKTFFPEQAERLRYLKDKREDRYCPIDVRNAFDNSLFTPNLNTSSELTIVAAESCRTYTLKYNRTVNFSGFETYRFKFEEPTGKRSCLDESMGIKLHQGMFDVSKCLFNDVPAAFSSPHFFGSSYNWSEHFEGLFPNALHHEPSITIEPITGIPVKETYRFQSNIPMPDMTGYNKDLQRFSRMVVPTFWYEFELDELPFIVLLLMRIQVYIAPVSQPIIMILLITSSFYAFLNVYLLLKDKKLKDLTHTCLPFREKTVDKTLNLKSISS